MGTRDVFGTSRASAVILKAPFPGIFLCSPSAIGPAFTLGTTVLGAVAEVQEICRTKAEPTYRVRDRGAISFLSGRRRVAE
jgi:hypothetical protein